jgi:hypothetical protein
MPEILDKSMTDSIVTSGYLCVPNSSGMLDSGLEANDIWAMRHAERNSSDEFIR